MITGPAQIEKIIQDVIASPKTISLLINTRKRFAELQEAIHSVLSNARRPDNVEIILRIDDDDDSTISQLHLLSPDIKTIIGKRNGYEHSNVGFMEMTSQASGEFVMPFSDDLLLGKNWDDYVHVHRGQVCVIWTKQELTMIIHRSIPLIWEQFCPAILIEHIYKIVSLELKIYVRYEELILIHDHRGTVRDYEFNIDDFQWPRLKDKIYEFTDVLKPFVRPKLFSGFTPITSSQCNTWSHPINDYARGKIYWWPILPESNPGYWHIKDAGEWFHPGSNWHYIGE